MHINQLALVPVVVGLPEGGGRGVHCTPEAVSALQLLPGSCQTWKPAELQPSFCSQLDNREGKRSQKLSNVSVMLCPTCWAHLCADALS